MHIINKTLKCLGIGLFLLFVCFLVLFLTGWLVETWKVKTDTPSAASSIQADTPQVQENQNNNEATTTVEDYKYGNVDFRVVGYPLEPEYFLEVFQNGSKVITGGTADGSINPCPTVWVGYTQKCQSTPAFGVDITGNGNKDFVFEYTHSGSYEQVNYSIFGLSKNGTIKEIARINTQGGASFEDLDHDGRLDLHFVDGTFNEWNSSNAGSPRPEVTLSWSAAKQRFALNQALMHTAAPSEKELVANANIFKESEDVSDWCRTASHIDGCVPWGYALQLIYSGNAASARQYMDLLWPIIGGKSEVGEIGIFASEADLESQLMERLQWSPYYEDLLSFNNGRIF